MSRSEHLSITRPGKSTGLEVRIWQIILQLWTMAFWLLSFRNLLSVEWLDPPFS